MKAHDVDPNYRADDFDVSIIDVSKNDAVLLLRDIDGYYTHFKIKKKDERQNF